MAFSLPSKATLVTLSLVPVVVPAISLVVVQAVVSRYVSVSATQRRVLTTKDKEATTAAAAAAPDATTVADAVPPHSLPDEVFGDGAPYVVFCERVVSKPIPLASLAVAPTDDAAAPGLLLTTYLRGTMGAFSWTPMGLVLRRFVSDPAVRATFDAGHIAGLAFSKGDLVCGPHLVTYRTADRAELTVQPLADKPDLSVHAVVVAAVERSEDKAAVVFVNETWFWRHAQEERPSMLESAAGRWLHNLIGGWMVFKGTRSVTTPVKVKAD